MKPEDLKVGHLYRLTESVDNPAQLDRRRSRSDVIRTIPIFAEGRLFVCSGEYDAPRSLYLLFDSNEGQGIFVGRSVEGAFIHGNREDRKLVEAIVPLLEEVEIDSWNLLRKVFHRAAPVYILRELYEDGTISHDRITSLMFKHTPGMGIFNNED